MYRSKKQPTPQYFLPRARCRWRSVGIPLRNGRSSEERLCRRRQCRTHASFSNLAIRRASSSVHMSAIVTASRGCCESGSYELATANPPTRSFTTAYQYGVAEWSGVGPMRGGCPLIVHPQWQSESHGRRVCLHLEQVPRAEWSGVGVTARPCSRGRSVIGHVGLGQET